MDRTCKICSDSFSSKGFHGHLRKSHNLFPNEYYHKFYPRKDKFTGELLPFIDYDQYFTEDFATKSNMEKWLLRVDNKRAKEFILGRFVGRIKEKELSFIPSYVEICTTDSLPSVAVIEKIFGSLQALHDELSIKSLYYLSSPDKINIPKDAIVLIDTREQQPLSFPHWESHKLGFGDYTFKGDHYTYTYVDRKSEQDFKGTVTNGYDRFLREVERSASLGSYIFVVVESSIEDIEKNNKTCAHPVKMKYVWANMRKIQHLYPRKVQFVFSGSRKRSEFLIPYILAYGESLWDKDVQYLLYKKYGVDNR